MSKTPCRNRFSRFTVKVHLEDRIRELRTLLDSALPMSFPKETAYIQGSLQECKRLLKHWKLEKT